MNYTVFIAIIFSIISLLDCAVNREIGDIAFVITIVNAKNFIKFCRLLTVYENNLTFMH